MTGFAHADVNRHTGLIQIEGVGADGESIHAQISWTTAIDLAAELEIAALGGRTLAPLVDDRDAFDDSLMREEVERT